MPDPTPSHFPTDLSPLRGNQSLAGGFDGESGRAAPKPVSSQPRPPQGEFLCDREAAWDREKEAAGEDVYTVADAGQAGDGFRDDCEPGREADGGQSDAFAPETDGDFDARQVGEHSRQAPPGQQRAPKARGRGR